MLSDCNLGMRAPLEAAIVAGSSKPSKDYSRPRATWPVASSLRKQHTTPAMPLNLAPNPSTSVSGASKFFCRLR
eukprot:scaffold67497_cov30-Prasinocladus_malaysianus.AAC.3